MAKNTREIRQNNLKHFRLDPNQWTILPNPIAGNLSRHEKTNVLQVACKGQLPLVIKCDSDKYPQANEAWALQRLNQAGCTDAVEYLAHHSFNEPSPDTILEYSLNEICMPDIKAQGFVCLDDKRPKDPQQQTRLCLEIAAAVHRIHHLGVCHGDLCSHIGSGYHSNVWWKMEGKNPRVKFIDFEDSKPTTANLAIRTDLAALEDLFKHIILRQDKVGMELYNAIWNPR